MRFLVSVMSTPDTEETFEGSPELYADMAKFNQQLVDAGVLLAGEGLHPSRKGARVLFDAEKRTVVDGPFTESKELIAGYWILELSSLEECVAWVKKVPNPMGTKSEIQIRQIMGAEDFEGVAPPEVLEHEERMRAQVAEQPPRPWGGCAPHRSVVRSVLVTEQRSDDERARATVEAVWRIEAPRLVAALSRLTRDVGLAEDLAQDALVAALEQWPAEGVPDNPGAWLMTTARRRGIDGIRRDENRRRKYAEIALTLEREEATEPGADSALDDPVGDDLLRLVLTACHPVLSQEAQVALTLRMLGGLTTAEIARAFLSSEQTVAQRIVRAKRRLAQADVPFEVPGPDELPDRLPAALAVVYLVFNEGYSATAGDDWTRPALCEDALRLGRVLARVLPREAEVHGLVALMELQASRMRARTARDGSPVLLLDQDRARWDRLLISRGLDALALAESLAPRRGTYTLQAGIAACHARARSADDTDWTAIVGLYDELLDRTHSPVVALNRAVALTRAEGPEAALEEIDLLATLPELAAYHYLPAVRGDVLARLGRTDEARVEFARAAAMTGNAQERATLLRRAEV
jgi:RNA polymerase sigma factor (sigma-70 family)